MIQRLLLLLLLASSACLADTINVSSFGAKGDARKVTDAVLSGSTVTSATANFTNADLGRMVWGIETASGAARLPVCAVTSIDSESSITVSGTAGSYSGVSLVIGTDDSDATLAADQTGATYDDESGDPNTLYYYRIIAKRSQVPSLPSNVVSDTTPA